MQGEAEEAGFAQLEDEGTKGDLIAAFNYLKEGI